MSGRAAATRGSSLRIFAAGLRATLRHPSLVVWAYVSTLIAAAVPASLMLMQLGRALDRGYPPGGAFESISADWWIGAEQSSSPLLRLVSPRALGAAAPLDALSALLDGDLPPPALSVTLALYVVVWSFTWGVVLSRLTAGQSQRASGSWMAGRQWLLPFLGISVVAAAALTVLYLTVHVVLFDVLYSIVATSLDERARVILRVGFSVLFAACLIAVSLTADVARILAFVSNDRSVLRAVADAGRFVSARPLVLIGLSIISIATGGFLMATYAAGDLLGGARVGGWRGVVLAQAYVVLRSALRIAWGASLVALIGASPRSRP